MYSTQVSLINSHKSHYGSDREQSIAPRTGLDPNGGEDSLKSERMPRDGTSERTESSAARRLTVSFEYMRAHLNEPIRVSTLCALAGLSPSRFFELFKSATGDTPLNWIIRARMQRAGELLETSTLQVKEVDWKVGYEDPFYFSRLFKSVHGVPPSQDRRLNPRLPASLWSR